MRGLVADPGPNLAPYQLSQRHVVLDERRASADDKRLQRFTRAVLLLEQSRSPEDLVQVARLLRGWLGSFVRGAGPSRTPAEGSSDRGELKRAFADWLWVLCARLRSGDEPPPPELTLEDVAMTLEERVISWREPLIRQGVEQGRQQGVERERALLRRLAEARFGADTAGRLFALLAREDDSQRLATIGEAIVRCETSGELLRRARQTSPNAHGTMT